MNTSRSLLRHLVRYIEKLNTTQKRALWYLADAAIFLLATTVVYYFFVDIILLPRLYYIVSSLLSFMIYFFAINLTKLSSRIKRYSNLTDIIQIFLVTMLASLLGSFSSFVIFEIQSWRYASVVSLLTALGVASLRLLWQSVYLTRDRNMNANGPTENIVLIGAGEGGSLFMSSYSRRNSNYNIVAIIDRDPGKVGMNIAGVKVVGGLNTLPALVKEYKISRAIIAIKSLAPEEYEKVLEHCNKAKIKVYNMPKVEDFLLSFNQIDNALRQINIADLLGRKEISLDESVFREELEGQTILITGAGGSIGSEISRQISKIKPERILLLGHGEDSIYHIYQEHLRNRDSMTQYVPIIADIQDYNRLVQIFEEEQPDIVYHAAAHKHVPLMEVNPAEAFKNNVKGTLNVAKAVDVAKVPKMVMLSTDKAVRPPNVMGATKRIAELIITGMNHVSDSVYCAVRFGNVLGSRGSVVPAFRQMIEEGGPVKVTDFRMIRYFMTIPEASRLVIYAGAHATGGEVFILNMGEPVRILDLARKMILLGGYSEGEIDIVESGIRPGEKLYEELLTSSELVDNQLDDNIFIGKVTPMSITEIEEFVAKLNDLIYDKREIKDQIVQFANRTTEE